MDQFLHKINIFGPGKGFHKFARDFHHRVDEMLGQGTFNKGARRLLDFAPRIAENIVKAVPVLRGFSDEIAQGTKIVADKIKERHALGCHNDIAIQHNANRQTMQHHSYAQLSEQKSSQPTRQLAYLDHDDPRYPRALQREPEKDYRLL